MTTITEEPEIPESDDLPEEDDDQDDDEAPDEDDLAADTDPHGHPHTPGFPSHRHREDRIVYDYQELHQAGGPELFPIDRHDSDSTQAEGLEADRQDNRLGSLAIALADTARSLGWQAEVTPHGGSTAGRIITLHRPDHDITLSVVYDA